MIKRINCKNGFINAFGVLHISPFAIIAFVFIIMWEASVYPLLILLSVLFHELSHIFCLKRFCCTIDGIYIYPFGADIVSDTSRISYRQELMVSLAGVFANFALFLLSYAVFLFTEGAHILFFCACNAFFAVTNLMPISTLDGARALEAFLCCHLPLYTSLSICKAVSVAAFALVCAFFVWCAVKSGNNLSLIAMLSYSILGLIASQKIKT